MTSKHKNISAALPGMHFAGLLQCFIVDSKTGKTVKTFAKQKNLVLNSGLNQLATQGPHLVGTYGVIGTGTTPTKRDSGSLTFTVSDTGAVVCSGAFLEAQDVGRILKLDTGEEFYFDAYTDNQNANVSNPPAVSIGATEGTIHYVNDVQLAAETKRTNSYVSGASFNGRAVAGGAITFKRTFEFSAETGSVTYREFGASWGSGSTNLFARSLLLTPVALISGQQLRVTYELTMTLGPLTPTAIAAPITGVAIDGDFQIESVRDTAWGNIQTTGAAVNFSDRAWVNQSGATINVGVGDSSQALAGPTNGDRNIASANRYTKGGSPESYVSGSFTRTAVCTFSTAEALFNIRSLYLAADGVGSSQNSAFRLLLDSSFLKDNLHTLTIRFRYTFGRTLAN